MGWVIVIFIMIFCLIVNYFNNTRVRNCPYCESELTPIYGNYYCPNCDKEFNDEGLYNHQARKEREQLKEKAREDFYKRKDVD